MLQSQNVILKNRISEDFSKLSPKLKQLVAYYDHALYLSLPLAEQKLVRKLTPDEIQRIIARLSPQQYRQLDELCPVAITLYTYNHDKAAYHKRLPEDKNKLDMQKMYEQSRSQYLRYKQWKKRDRLNQESTVENQVYDSAVSLQADGVIQSFAMETFSLPLSASSVETFSAPQQPYTFNEFTNEYHYHVNTDEFVDPLFLTANRKAIDLFLPGKSGLDVSLVRTYNSLQSKLMQPSYVMNNDPDTPSAEGNQATITDPASVPGFIATGWSLNLPVMSRNIVTKEIQEVHQKEECPGAGYENTGICYTTSYMPVDIDPVEKVIFTLDDGSTYEFRNGVIQHYPYQNVAFTQTANEYQLILNERITYVFDADGRIARKTNEWGDQVSYTYAGSNIVVIDSYGRELTIYRNEKAVITGFAVRDEGKVIKQLAYDVTPEQRTVEYRKWSPESIETVTEAIPYWQLNAVIDTTQRGQELQLESYDYEDMGPAQLADFNMKPNGYEYQATPDWNVDFNEGNNQILVWEQADTYYDLESVVDRRAESYGEIPYLLLKSIHYYNGLNATFYYQSYNPQWSSLPYTDMESSNKRGSTRLYQDRYALQYVGYHAVQQVNLTYTEDGQEKEISLDYQNLHTDHGHLMVEYWQNAKGNVPRLRGSSRFADQQTIERTEYVADGKKRTYRHYQHNGEDFLLQYEWTTAEGLASLDFSENDAHYTTEPAQVTAYQYPEHGLKPVNVQRFAGTIADPQHPSIDSAAQPTRTTIAYDTWGLPVAVTDELGNVTRYEYNGPYHQLTRKTVASADGVTAWEENVTFYSASDSDSTKQNQPKQHTSVQHYPQPQNVSNVQTDTVMIDYLAYDADHRVLQQVESASGAQMGQEPTQTKRSYTYTARGQVASESTEVSLEQGQAQSTLTLAYAYWENGNVKQVTYPDQSTVSYAYDSLNRVTSVTFQPVAAAARTTMWSYDDGQRKVTSHGRMAVCKRRGILRLASPSKDRRRKEAKAAFCLSTKR